MTGRPPYSTGYHIKESALVGVIWGTRRSQGNCNDGCWTCVMQLFVKVIPLRHGTGEPAGEPRLLRCPPSVAPDAIL